MLCVPTADPRLTYLADLPDLEPFHKLEIQHFFEIYQDLEPGKSIDTEHGVWADRAQAEAEVTRSRLRAVRAVPTVPGPVEDRRIIESSVHIAGRGSRGG